METVNQIIDSMTAIGMIFAVVASFLVVLTAGIQALRMRAVRWDALLFILVVLWAIPIGLRYYGPQLMDASTDSIIAMAEKGPRLREAIKDMLSDVAEPWQGGGGLPTAEPAPAEVDVSPPTVVPEVTDDTGMTPTTTPEATATPQLPTATPTQTAVPTLDLDNWNIQTPPPTPIVWQ
jgi:hypothetical protein